MNTLRFEPWGTIPKRGTRSWWGVFLRDTNATKVGEVYWYQKGYKFKSTGEVNYWFDAAVLDELSVFLKNALYFDKERAKKRRHDNKQKSQKETQKEKTQTSDNGRPTVVNGIDNT